MAVIDVLNSVFTALDQVGTSSLQTIYTSISSGITPVFTTGLTVYIAYYGYEVLFGRATISVTDFFWKIVRMALIYAMISNWSGFQTIVANTFLQTADSVGASICNAMLSAGGSGSSGSCPTPSSTSSGLSSMATGLNTIWTTGSTAADGISQASGMFGVGLALLAIILYIVTALVLIEAVAIVIMGKLALYVLLGLAPLFIVMALFNVSSSLFTGWMRSCLSFSLVPILTYGFIGFFLGLINSQQSALSGAGANATMLTIAPFAVICVVATLILAQIPSMASAIAGGAGLRHSSAVSAAEGYLMARAVMAPFRLARLGPNAVGGAAAAAGNAWRASRSNSNGGGNAFSAGANTMSAAAQQVAAGLKATKSG